MYQMIRFCNSLQRKLHGGVSGVVMCRLMSADGVRWVVSGRTPAARRELVAGLVASGAVG